MSDLPIGIFDSGLGGLTVVAEMMRAMPSESVLYFGDTARCPYGPRPLKEVRDFVLQIGRWLSRHQVKLLVIACNTGTAAGLEIAQQTFQVPVIGVIEPGARAAAKATINRRVGVIGTAGTIDSGAYSRAVRAIDAGVTVFSVATPRFVDVVESGLRVGPGALEGTLASISEIFIRPSFHEMARDYLDPLRRTGIDTLVLGCTHFPLLAPAIQQVVGSRVRLISSAEETAREVAETLLARDDLATEGVRPKHRFATTGDAVEFTRLGALVVGQRIPPAEHVPLSDLEVHDPEADPREGGAACG